MNVVVLSGIVKEDIDYKTSAKGHTYCNVKLSFKTLERNVENEFKSGDIQVVCFEKNVKILKDQNVRKGSRITVTGSLDHQIFEIDGVIKSFHKIRALIIGNCYHPNDKSN